MGEVSRCRSCRAPVLWVSLESGKQMPVDEAESESGHYIVFSDRGRLLAVNVTDRARLPAGVVTTRHDSHFATCPQSKDWRKKR